MKRLLKFAAFFLATAAVVLGLVFYFSWDSITAAYKNRKGLAQGSEWIEKTYSLKGLTEFIGEHPEFVSIASYTLSNPEEGIYYNEQEKRTMGGLSNLVLILEYARQAENEMIDPNGTIRLQKLDNYRLPEIKSGIHEDVRDFWDENEMVSGNTIQNRDLIHTLARFNDPIIADYFFYFLGPNNLNKLYQQLELSQTESLLPYIGYYITIHPALHDASNSEHLSYLTSMKRPEFDELVKSNAEKYLNDLSYRNQVRAVFRREGLPFTFIHQRKFNQLLPKSTAMEMSRIMQAMVENELFPARAEPVVRSILNWPMDNRRMHQDFISYGALYDSRMGILNGVDYGISKYTGKQYVQAVFFDNLPVGFWLHMSANHMHQDFQQRLIWDPALNETTRQAINDDSLKTSATATP